MKKVKKNILLRKFSIGLAGAFLLMFTLSSEVKAQILDPIYPYSIEVRAGASIPSGDYADLNDAGFDIGLKLGYFFTDRLSFRVDLESAFLTGKPINLNGTNQDWPNTQLWHYTAGLGYMVTDPALTAFRFGLNAGLGATTITYDDADELNDTYFTVNYGAKFGYGLTEMVDIFANVMGYTIFGDDNDLSDVDTFTTWPITLGLDFRF